MTDKERLESIRKDLEKRIKNLRETNRNTVGFGKCGMTFDGIAEIFEYILIEHFGEKCANCHEKCIPVENGRCRKCQDLVDNGIG